MPYTTTSILDAARASYDLGYIPVPVRGKAPFIPGWSDYSMKNKPRPKWAEVETWFREPNTGFALLCGTPHVVDGVTYRLLGLDIDLHDHDACMDIMRQIPVTPSVKRGSKGFTAFYLVPEDMAKRGGVRAAYDYLAKGSVTVMPPSMHPDPDVGEYTWRNAQYLSEVGDGRMAAPHELPIFDEDAHEQMMEAVEEHIPEPVIEVPKREYDGSEPVYCSTAWINNELVKHENMRVWLPELLDAARIKHEITKSGKILTVNPTRQGGKAGDDMDARSLHWHFTADGVEGRNSSIVDFGVPGSTWTPLDAIAAIATGEDIRGGAVPDDIYDMGLRYADPELYTCIKDDAGWEVFVQANAAAALARSEAAAAAKRETLIDARAAELKAAKAEAEEWTGKVATAEEVLAGDESNIRDRRIEAEIDVKAIGPVPKRVVDEAPGVIGLIVKDLQRRHPDTPASMFLIYGMNMVATMAARRFEAFTPKTLPLNVYSIQLGTTGIGKGEVVGYNDRLWQELEKVNDPRFMVAKLSPILRYKMHRDHDAQDEAALIGPKRMWHSAGAAPTEEGGEAVGGGWQEEHPTSAKKPLLESVFALLAGPSDFTGDSGFVNSLYKGASRLYFSDEFGSKFESAVRQADSNNPSWFASARELFYRFRRRPKAYSQGSIDKQTLLDEDLFEVSPTIFGVSTPQQFTRALTDRLTEDGTLNRYLLFQEQRPKRIEMTVDERRKKRFSASGDRDPIPTEIIDGLSEILIRKLPPPGLVPSMIHKGGFMYDHPLEYVIFSGARVPDKYRVEITFEGRTWQELYGSEIGDYIDDLIFQYEERIEKAYAEDDHYTGNALVRGAELTLRCAALAAIGDGRDTVTIADLQWAEELARASVNNLIAMTNTQMTSQRTKDEQRFLDLIRKGYREVYQLEGGRKRLPVYGEGMISLPKLRRAFFNNKSEDHTRFNSVVRSLVQARIIQEPFDQVVAGSKRPVSVTTYAEAWDETGAEYVELQAQEKAQAG